MFSPDVNWSAWSELFKKGAIVADLVNTHLQHVAIAATMNLTETAFGSQKSRIQKSFEMHLSQAPQFIAVAKAIRTKQNPETLASQYASLLPDW
ncbi:MAG: hypothetical protein LDL41_05030 [Coleofasciculus sp. S288]|nr:hypothetical protein [Coleofasciculus sp. S288]